MWQPPDLRRTQRTSLRRMGLFACLMTVLLLGFLLGRSTREEQGPDQVYLNNAGPAQTTPTPTVRAEGEHRAPLARVIRPTAIPSATRGRPSPQPTRELRDEDDERDDDGPRYILSGPREDDDDDSFPPVVALENEVVRLVNAERRRAGCAPLRVDRRLTRSARTHSSEMAADDDFSHNSPDGASPWQRMEAAGYRDGGAENIGRGHTSAAEAVRSWMTTRSHRANILNCALTATGVGVVNGPGGLWWTQDFGYS
ncbi:serine protease [Streptosporangium violaceochromogenes]|nr:serine protease [Streptosporangium violaceochromogenes]